MCRVISVTPTLQCLHSDPAWPPDEPWSLLVGSNYLTQLFHNHSGFPLIQSETGFHVLSPCLCCCLPGGRVSRRWETTRRCRSSWRTWRPAWETAARKSSQVREQSHDTWVESRRGSRGKSQRWKKEKKVYWSCGGQQIHVVFTLSSWDGVITSHLRKHVPHSPHGCCTGV